MLIGVGTTEELRRSRSCSRRGGARCRLRRSSGSRRRSARRRAPTSRSSVPATRRTATTRRTSRMRLAGVRKQPPRAIAEELAERAAGASRRRRARRSPGPGFVNLWLAPAWYGDALAEILAAGDRYGAGSAHDARARAGRARLRQPDRPDHRRARAERRLRRQPSRACSRSRATRSSASTTTTTPARRWSASGARSTRVRRGEPPPEDGYHGAYIAELAAIPGDPVPPMLERIAATLHRFRIDFDEWALESALAARLPELLPRLDTYEKDGALWARSSAYGDDEDRVLIRSEGRGPTYRAADVVYLDDKLGRGFDRAIYVLGADHHGTRNWYAAVARMLGHDPDRIEVLLYQLVHLTRGGAATKMSKRRGDVVFLDDFLDEIGVDAARWYLVSRGPDQAIEIDVDLAAEKLAEEPGLLRPVRARPDRRHPAQRRRREPVRRAAGGARRRGARPRQAARRVPGARRRGDRAPRPARDPDLRDPGRRRLPPLLPPPQGARLRDGGLPPRPLHGDEVGDRPLPRLDRRRGTRHDVAPC